MATEVDRALSVLNYVAGYVSACKEHDILIDPGVLSKMLEWLRP